MRRWIGAFVVAAMVVTAGVAKPFDKRATREAQLIQSGPEKMWCAVCGMNLKMFYKTSHAVVLKDGTKKQYCSIRCLAADWKSISDKIDKILVVDADTEKLIDATKAYYVVGSKVKGTMSMTSKIAFGSLEEAKAFQKAYGGEIVDFKTALKRAKASLKRDTAMVAKKKKSKIYPMGQKIYKRMCQPVDVTRYGHINELKAAIKTRKLCKPMKEKQLQAVALYLWEGASARQTQGTNRAREGQIRPKKDEKCPVCGMFVYKYPKWAAYIFYGPAGDQKRLVFDGVKDMMKFYLDPVRWGYDANIKRHISRMAVQDYYTLTFIPAESAWYVVGSDVYGPMGNELIPFASKEAAERFLKDHHGKRIVRFDEIEMNLLRKLDE